MIFYSVEGEVVEIQGGDLTDSGEVKKPACKWIARQTNHFIQKKEKKAGCFIEILEKNTVTVIVITEERNAVALAKEFLATIAIRAKDLSAREITFEVLRSTARTADRNGFLSDKDDFLENFNLGDISSSLPFGEGLLDCRNRKELEKSMREKLVKKQMNDEIERIYAGRAIEGVEGHPVHYMLFTDDRDQRREMSRILMDALYANGRITNRRFGFYDLSGMEHQLGEELKELYEVNRGGCAVIRFRTDSWCEEDEYAGSYRDAIETIGETATKYRNQVLTVLCLPLVSKEIRQMIYSNLDAMTMVEIREDSVNPREARGYLRRLASEAHLTPDEKLYAALEEGKQYTASLIRPIFDKWHAETMKTAVYPQYRMMETAEVKVLREKPKGNAFNQLHDMIGLDTAKEVICRAINYFKYQKMLARRSTTWQQPSLHMCFTGNPGTAKTTVARLVARILADNGVLSTGAFVEVGRGDLVGKYVGWTATIVKKRFEEAAGGVLFIDEAYSLLDDRNGSFGDEAINTIVREMENHREDVIVIFAGYPDKMEAFLQRNPGLRSRIAFHVPFADYTAEELCRIAEQIAGMSDCRFSKEAEEKLYVLFDSLRLSDDFGNGRCARNIVESARMRLADRMVRKGWENLAPADLCTILPEDIEMPPMTERQARKWAIGFAG